MSGGCGGPPPGAATRGARAACGIGLRRAGAGCCRFESGRAGIPSHRIVDVRLLLVRHNLSKRSAQPRQESGAAVLEHQGPEVAGIEELDPEGRICLLYTSDAAD